jgi:hypothetical protein
MAKHSRQKHPADSSFGNGIVRGNSMHQHDPVLAPQKKFFPQATQIIFLPLRRRDAEKTSYESRKSKRNKNPGLFHLRPLL